MGRRDQRFQDVLDLLRGQFDSSFAPGESLPSTRELAAMHGFGARTIERALKVLAAEGFVKVIPSVGSFRAPAEGIGSPVSSARRNAKRQTPSVSVGLMTRRTAGEWSACAIYPALMEEARKRNIKVVALPNPRTYRQIPKRNQIELTRIPWNTFDVGLLVEAEETIRLRDPLLLERRILAVDQNATGYGIDSVAFADAQAGAMVARHLIELGHKRFAVTEEFNDPGFSTDPAWTARRHGFEVAIEESGGTLQPQWRLLVARRSFNSSAGNFFKPSVAAWAAVPPGQRPTALFAYNPSPFVLGRIVDELASHGLRVPRDVSVVSQTWDGQIYGGGEPEKDGMRYTCIDFDLAALVRRVFDAATELAEEKGKERSLPRRAPKLFLAPVSLVTGQSTVPPLA